MVTLAGFKERFPEFSTVSDERIQIFLDDSSLMIGTNWGKLQDLGTYYLTAHNLEIAEQSAGGDSGAMNPVSNESVGSVSTGYATNTSDKESNQYYMSTTYGQRYLELRSRIAVGAVFSI